MKLIGIRCSSPRADDWLATTRQPRILHVFDRACNLINEHRGILSIVAPEIDSGPFNLVVEDEIDFSEHLDLDSAIIKASTQLHLGDMTIRLPASRLWNPRPDWEALHSRCDQVSNQLQELQNSDQLHQVHIAGEKFSASILPFSHSLARSLAAADLPSAIAAAKRVAGSGIGLTPSSDDFMMGALHAAWIIHPREIAQHISAEIAAVAAPLTTSLSAAWLRAAANGETGVLWHRLFDALISGPPTAIEAQASRILAVGATSGAEALTGFTDTFIALMEIENQHVIP